MKRPEQGQVWRPKNRADEWLGCFQQKEKGSFTDNNGRQIWKENRLYKKTPYDGRAPADRPSE